MFVCYKMKFNVIFVYLGQFRYICHRLDTGLMLGTQAMAKETWPMTNETSGEHCMWASLPCIPSCSTDPVRLKTVVSTLGTYLTTLTLSPHRSRPVSSCTTRSWCFLIVASDSSLQSRAIPRSVYRSAAV